MSSNEIVRDRTVARTVRRRRAVPVFAAAVLSLAVLAGCGSSSSSSSSDTSGASDTTTTVASSASSDTSASSDSSGTANTAAYLAAMHSQPHFQGISDDNLTTLGNAVCSDFSGGATFNQTAQDAIDGVNKINANDAESGNNPGGSLTTEDAGFLIGAAVKGLCPQYSNQLPTE